MKGIGEDRGRRGGKAGKEGRGEAGRRGEGRSGTANIKAFPSAERGHVRRPRSFAGRSRWAWGCCENFKRRQIAAILGVGVQSALSQGRVGTLSR